MRKSEAHKLSILCVRWVHEWYLGGQGDLVSGLVLGITGVVISLERVTRVLTKSP